MKIIVASFQCESNSKAKLHPKKHDFEYFKGQDIFKKLAVKEVFENAGFKVIPSIYAVALPSATVQTAAAYAGESLPVPADGAVPDSARPSLPPA